MRKPNVIVEVRGGLVDGIVSDSPVNVYVVDHDIEQADEEDLKDFPVAKGETKKVVLCNFDVDRNPGFVKSALKMLGITKRKSSEVECSLCGKLCPASTAHLHQGKYIGEECWDDRLKASE